MCHQGRTPDTDLSLQVPSCIYRRTSFLCSGTWNINIESGAGGSFVSLDDLAVFGVVLPEYMDLVAVHPVAAHPAPVGIRIVAICGEIESDHAFVRNILDYPTVWTEEQGLGSHAAASAHAKTHINSFQRSRRQLVRCFLNRR